MAIYAHRGASIERPENTLAAIRRAIQIGAPGIEIDVHLTADGHPVVIHDDTVDRTTNGTGVVADLTLDTLRELDAGDGERIPTLAEVLDIVAGKSKLDIEVKTVEVAAAVLVDVGRYPDLAWLISSFEWEALAHVREQQPDAELWVLDDTPTDAAILAARDLGATVLNVRDDSVDAGTVASLRDQGIEVGVWTVNDPDEAARLRDIGVAHICTDDPAALRNVYPLKVHV